MAGLGFKSPQDNLQDLQADLARTIVATLRLDIEPSQIEPDAPLFNDGLGLDSIDALEIALCVSERYRVQLRSDDPNNKRIFASLRNLAEHIAAHLPPPADPASVAKP